MEKSEMEKQVFNPKPKSDSDSKGPTKGPKRPESVLEMMVGSDLSIYHALIAFAIAFALVGFLIAATGPDRARNANPQYWHYKHHDFPSTKCDENCQFKKNIKDVDGN